MDRSKALAALSALAHETRLDLVRLLVPQGSAGMPAGQIAQVLGLAAPRLSFHLAALEQAGLLSARRVARNVIYSVDPKGLGGTVAYLLNHCCCDDPEILAMCSTGDQPKTAGCRQGLASSGTEKT